MDLLKRDLAPITDAAWAEIESAVTRALRTHLSARRVVDVSTGGGFSRTCVGLGRLDVPDGQEESGVRFGIHRVQPLVEARIAFNLSTWELDDVERGARDLDLEAAEQAAIRIAEFEDSAVFNGFPGGGIEGILAATPHEAVPLPAEPAKLLDAVAKGLIMLRDAGIAGPYALVVGRKAFRTVMSTATGYPLKKQLDAMLENGGIVYEPVVEGAVLLSTRGGDLELVLGQDLSLGYESHTKEAVRLFLTESFTFRILEAKGVVRYEPR